ncbi:MAG: hypothetical protein SGPRY_007376 [Prymnesium sp.]
MGCTQSATSLPVNKREAILKSADELSGMSADHIHKLASCAKISCFFPGDEIEGIRDVAKNFCVILEGEVELSKVSWAVGDNGFERMKPRPERRETRTLAEGQSWGGERLALEISKRTGSFGKKKQYVDEIVVALTKTRVMMLSSTDYADLCQKYGLKRSASELGIKSRVATPKFPSKSPSTVSDKRSASELSAKSSINFASRFRYTIVRVESNMPMQRDIIVRKLDVSVEAIFSPVRRSGKNTVLPSARQEGSRLRAVASALPGLGRDGAGYTCPEWGGRLRVETAPPLHTIASWHHPAYPGLSADGSRACPRPQRCPRQAWDAPRAVLRDRDVVEEANERRITGERSHRNSEDDLEAALWVGEQSSEFDARALRIDLYYLFSAVEAERVLTDRGRGASDIKDLNSRLSESAMIKSSALMGNSMGADSESFSSWLCHAGNSA